MEYLVGQSDRTIGKHRLLDKVVGKEVGSFPYVKFLKPPYVIIDLCAGDGMDSISGTSSPKILAKHYQAALRNGSNPRLILCEKNVNAFAQLRSQPWLLDEIELFNLDAKTLAESLDPTWQSKSHAFIHHDPNKVTDWCLSENLLKLMPSYFTTMSTLGCNVSGLKRLGTQERELWNEKIWELISWLPKHHTALLAVLVKDEAQWAYLLTGPKVWVKQYEQNLRTSFGYWNKGLEISTLDNAQFARSLERLVYTKKELSCG